MTLRQSEGRGEVEWGGNLHLLSTYYKLGAAAGPRGKVHLIQTTAL